MNFQDLFPTPEGVLELRPEELGVRMLPLLAELSAEYGLDPGELQNRVASDASNALPLAHYPLSARRGIREAIMRAWQWLRKEGLVVDTPEGVGGFRWRISDDAIDLSRSSNPLAAIRNGKIQLLSQPGAIIGDLAVNVQRLGFDTIERDISRAMLSLADDPEDAVTAACSMIESVCRSLLVELGLPMPDKKDIDGLIKAVQEPLGLSPGQPNIPAEVVQDVRQILGGLTSVAKGVGALRTHAGDAHGREALYPKLDARAARLAINAAGSLSLYLIETWEARHGGRPNLRERGDRHAKDTLSASGKNRM